MAKSSLVALSSSFHDRLEAEWFAQSFKELANDGKELANDGTCRVVVEPKRNYDGSISSEWLTVSVAPKYLKRAEDFLAGIRSMKDLEFFRSSIESYARSQAETNAGKEASQLECLGRARYERDRAFALKWDGEAGRAPVGWEALVEGHEKTARAYEEAAKLHPRYPEIKR